VAPADLRGDWRSAGLETREVPDFNAGLAVCALRIETIRAPKKLPGTRRSAGAFGPAGKGHTASNGRGQTMVVGLLLFHWINEGRIFAVLFLKIGRMLCGDNCKLCMFVWRRWYFTFPAFGIISGAVYLLTHREHELSALQTILFLGVMTLFMTVCGGVIVLIAEILVRIGRWLRK
jgi:hypothetical protein